jgi:murein DD-endopeptidase MepM/ murein hydrolase activator NlpD
MKRIVLLLLLLLPALRPAPVVRAQADGPVYIVQEGDSYWAIADFFKVTIPDLLAANGFSEKHVIFPGDRVVVPGYEGIHGILSTRTVELGETLATLALRTGIPQDTLLRLNRLTNPERLYAGQVLVTVEPEEEEAAATRWETGRMISLSAGSPLLAQAAMEGKNAWDLAGANNLSSPADQFSGQTLMDLGGEIPLRAWPSTIDDMQFRALPLVQGTTGEISLVLSQEGQTQGALGEWTLHFMADSGRLVALQGVHAQAEPGTYPFSITVTLADGRTAQFQQDVLVVSGNYPRDPDLKVPPATLDPEAIAAESELIRSIVAPVSEEKYWMGLFSKPATRGISSYFGVRRSYNNGAYYSFHTGVDFYGLEKEPIYAPAPGRVVFVSPDTETPICGTTTIIDHGWGVYTRYCHQNSVKVQVGEMVQAGQEIGLIGHTGRADGSHLHWEIWVGGVQINPLPWLEEIFP